MNIDFNEAFESGLQYFGKMTASISHEIKNVLAIMNENAGLMEDLVLMANKGRPLEPERLATLAGKIISQIQRADGIILNMNTFAHSVDEPLKHIDMGDTLGLVIALSKRFASMRGVTLELTPFPDPIRVTTNQFLLENIIWLCLDYAMDTAGRGKRVVVSAERAGNAILIRLAMPDGVTADLGRIFPSKREETLVGILSGQLSVHPDTGDIVLTLPMESKH
jgi:signal transduction histidine kinase